MDFADRIRELASRIPAQIPHLRTRRPLSKGSFEVGAILVNASDLKYTREIKRILNQELNQPSEEFVRFFTAQVYPGRMTQSIREQFTEITWKAFQQFISEKVSDRLKSALAQEQEATRAAAPVEEAAAEQGPTLDTTAEEMQAYYIVQAILAQMVDPERVILRDQKSYCSVLLDDSNRKPICRLWFNTSQKYIGLFDAAKVETRVPIANQTEIYRQATMLGRRWTAMRMAKPRLRSRRRFESAQSRISRHSAITCTCPSSAPVISIGAKAGFMGVRLIRAWLQVSPSWMISLS
jgi:hypothetical protein